MNSCNQPDAQPPCPLQRDAGCTAFPGPTAAPKPVRSTGFAGSTAVLGLNTPQMPTRSGPISSAFRQSDFNPMPSRLLPDFRLLLRILRSFWLVAAIGLPAVATAAGNGASGPRSGQWAH